MSAQMGGKKSGGSSNSSMVITPASTPVSTMANGQQASPPPNNAPKYGTLVPNRIFVGGISANTTETELLQLFSNYGTVKAAKIIQDRAGVSKGYGFITFESEDDAKRLQRDQDNIILRERKLNIAPAIKKQPFSRAFDGSSPPAVAPGFAPNFFPPGSMPFFQGGLAYYPQPPSGPADPATQPPAVFQNPSVYPPQSAPPQAAPYQQVMFPPQPIYMPQQYPMHMPCDYNYYPNGGASYIAGNNGGQNGSAQQSIAAGGQMQAQRPNSPPRQHCYAQQMPNATATAAYPAPDVYYSLPMYQVDGALYADPNALEAMSLQGGVVQEEYQPHPSQQDDYNTTQAKGGGGIVMRQPPHSPSQPPPTTQMPVQQGGERQTSTPVVSLLSLDHQQEKDLLSMQSGRRRKPPPSTPPAVSAVHHNAYGMPPQVHQHSHNATNGYAPYEYHYAHIVPSYTTSSSSTQSAAGQKSMTNGWSDANTQRGWNSNYHQHSHVSTSSREQQFTSAASAVDDSQHHPPSAQVNVSVNDDKRRYSQPHLLPRFSTPNHRPSYNYHHATHTTYQGGSGGGGGGGGGIGANSLHRRRFFFPTGNKQYRNSNRYSDYQSSVQSNSHTTYNKHTTPNGTPPPPLNNNNNNNTLSSSVAAKGASGGMPRKTPSPSAFGSQMQTIPQHFVAPARHRNNRRGTVRRGGGIPECGAGDAPLTNAGDGLVDACHKMDTLKL